ncbi:hypothetical protein BDQ17DRAFT_1544560 [Cyathus striatus]|nr:hypothetical protein BDQ17DRAFT_1544560 [Cyathus striatus]
MGKLPLYSSPSQSSSVYSFAWKLLAIAATSLALYTWSPFSDCHRFISNVSLDTGVYEDICSQPKPAASQSNYSQVYSTPEFLEESAKRLSGAIKIPTMTYDDMGPAESDERWAPFADFHKYLFKTYPVIHIEANLTIVGGYSLIYTFKGSDSSLKPLLLTAHQDVVPAVTSLDKWTHPPFSGVIDGGWIFGRGSEDCKNSLIALMTAVEHMLKSGWKPTRTLILAFGQDEEINGLAGAVNIEKHLKGIYGKNGIGMIVDEGGMGLDTQYGVQVALPGIAEKGYTNAFIEVDMIGGHSSVPSRYTTIGILSKIVSAIEDSNAFQPHIEKSSPIWGYLSCIAQYGAKSEIPDWIKQAVSSNNPDMKAVADRFAQTTPENRYMVQTSKAATLFNAGIKVNALAESATVTFNSRIDIFSSVEEVQNIYLNLIKSIAQTYSLRLNGASFSESPIGNISVIWEEGSSDPTPISPFTLAAPAWGVFARAVQASFGSDVISAPSAMNGNTDTRYYLDLSENIYRWNPARVGSTLNGHTVDEKIMTSAHVEGIRFFTELILQADDKSLEL